MDLWKEIKDYYNGRYFKFTKRFSWTGYTKPVTYEFFTARDLYGLQTSFILKIVDARKRTIAIDPEHHGVAFRISSGYRTSRQNESVIGAVPDSSHIKGLAVDLRVFSSREASIIIQACYAAGIDRVGIYVDANWQPVHVHADCDPEKISDVLFVKKEAN